MICIRGIMQNLEDLDRFDTELNTQIHVDAYGEILISHGIADTLWYIGEKE